MEFISDELTRQRVNTFESNRVESARLFDAFAEDVFCLNYKETKYAKDVLLVLWVYEDAGYYIRITQRPYKLGLSLEQSRNVYTTN